ncbi:MAG: hypothetical protein GVY18_09045 [Bacteroidetes bacterium]|jgi:hypothetical protein|nr:hypothetical protein [Bacteroidota bacterium]
MSEKNESNESPAVQSYRERLAKDGGKVADEFEELTPQERETVAEFHEQTRGRIWWTHLDFGGLVVFGKPDKGAWKRFLRESPLDDNSPNDVFLGAADNLCMASRLHPEKAELRAILDDCPGLSTDALPRLKALAEGRRPKG